VAFLREGNGVAIRSTYRRLKTVLDTLASEDKAHLGLVRYGSAHLVPGRVNLMINVSTKQLKYANEQEVRAMLWLIDPHETGNRHIDLDNRFHPRPIYLSLNSQVCWLGARISPQPSTCLRVPTS
jgi:hypothetical protein